jgi:signal transduction histidine kinase
VPTEGSAEQASLARSFNDMATRLGRLLEAQRRFVADASHQLRTPLTGLRLRIEEARDAPTREAAGAELDAADAELDRMGLVVEELLVLGRAGERELPGERVALDAVVRGAGERWRAAAAAAGAELRTSVVDAGVVWAAADDLDRALDALVENAVAYGASGGEIVVAAEGTTLAVRDRGPGFAAGEEEAVRERFHRGAAGQAGPPGTGLGLAIAGELGALWEGSLEVGARPGGGAEVRLAFPPARGER